MIIYIAAAGAVGSIVFSILFLLMLIKGNSLKIPFIGMAAFVILMAAGVVLTMLGNKNDSPDTADRASQAVESQGAEDTEAPESEGQEGESAPPTVVPTKEPEKTQSEAPSADPAPTNAATMGQRNALAKAKQYLLVMPFSYSKLIEQLEYEGYTAEEATYGADNCGADWSEQAAKKAQAYLDSMAFSRQGLIDQLKYEGFTQEQAEYGVSAVGY